MKAGAVFETGSAAQRFQIQMTDLRLLPKRRYFVIIETGRRLLDKTKEAGEE